MKLPQTGNFMKKPHLNESDRGMHSGLNMADELSRDGNLIPEASHLLVN